MASDPPGDMVAATGCPSSILLARKAYVVPSRNETTAAAKSRCDRTVEVTFWIADPPAVSFCSVHCSKPPSSDSENADLKLQPYVVAAEGRFVLLRTRFAASYGEDEYFMYKGDMKSPSLESIQLPGYRRLVVREFGILPRGNGYLLVGLYHRATSLDYELHIYSSEDQAWRIEKLINPRPDVDTIIPEKVVALGEGVLGMVDFWQGMLVCDLLHKPPVARYVPLPEPLPENIPKLKVFHPGATPRRFRDLTCSNGEMKFIEMEHRMIIKESTEIAPEKPKDPTHKDVLYDSELIRRQKQKVVESKPKRVYLMNGWRAVTWTREMESDCWRTGCSVDVDDILVDDSFAALLSGQSDDENLSFKNLNSAWPILSTEGDDLLYLKTVPEFRGSAGWVVAVDLAKKTLKVEGCGVEPHSLGGYVPSKQMYNVCTLSKHLNITPGIKVPAFCEITLAGSSVTDRNTKEVLLAELHSCKIEKKRLRLAAEKVNLAQNGSQSVMQNAHTLCMAEPDPRKTENKRPRQFLTLYVNAVHR